MMESKAATSTRTQMNKFIESTTKIRNNGRMEDTYDASFEDNHVVSLKTYQKRIITIRTKAFGYSVFHSHKTMSDYFYRNPKYV
jgi:hypothetical protein